MHAKPDMNELPNDLVAYLSSRKPLSYDVAKSEPGPVSLKRVDDLSVRYVYVDTNDSPLKDEDPHYREKGYYAVSAIDLIDQCNDSYDPSGILMWLPEYQMYGTWDSDHWHLIVFPDINWSDIVRDPLRFLNAQWSADLGKGEYLKAWLKSKFYKGMPF